MSGETSSTKKGWRLSYFNFYGNPSSSEEEADESNLSLPPILANVDLNDPHVLKVLMSLCSIGIDELRAGKAMNQKSKAKFQEQRVDLYQQKSNADDAIVALKRDLPAKKKEVKKMEDDLSYWLQENTSLEEEGIPAVEQRELDFANGDIIFDDLLYGKTFPVFDAMPLPQVHKAIGVYAEWEKIMSKGRKTFAFTRDFSESILKILSNLRYGNHELCDKKHIVASLVEPGVMLLKHTSRIHFDDKSKETGQELSDRVCDIIHLDTETGKFAHPKRAAEAPAAQAAHWPGSFYPPSPSPYQGNSEHAEMVRRMSHLPPEHLHQMLGTWVMSDPIAAQQASKAATAVLSGTKRGWTDESDTESVGSVSVIKSVKSDSEIDAEIAALNALKEKKRAFKRTKTTSPQVARSTHASPKSGTKIAPKYAGASPIAPWSGDGS